MSPSVGVVLKGYPRLSETFIAQELRALEERGLDLHLYSLRRPTDVATHPVHAEIRAPVDYLPEYLWRSPGRVAAGLAGARRLPGFARALAAWRSDLRRDPTPNRVRRFGQAAVLAHELAPGVAHLHAHFLHTPASVARYASLMTGIGWSCSAHAKDIWTTPAWEKREKLAEARFTVTCTRVNLEHLGALAPAGGRVDLVYHGLDLRRFPDPPASRPPRDGSDPGDPLRLLSVGRAVEKKGYDDLLEALARLPAGLAWRLDHVGGGPLLPRLRARAARLGLEARVRWHGSAAQGEVVRHCREADLFVLASRIARDGDRDGLPNVLMEAQSQGLACLSTRLSAIPELIEHARTGWLVNPRDVAGLAAAIERLAREPALRERLGAAGCERVRREFSFSAGIERLGAHLEAALAAAAP